MPDHANEGLRSAVKRMSDAVVLVDQHGIVDTVSQAFLRASGWSEEESVGKSFSDLIVGGQERPIDGQSKAPTRAAGSSTTETRQYHCRDGSFVPSETVSLPILGDDGRVCHYLHVIHDMPNRLRGGDDLKSLIAFLTESGSNNDIDISELFELSCRYFGVELGLFVTPRGEGERINAVGGNLVREIANQHLGKTPSSLSIRGSGAVLALADEDKPTSAMARIDLNILLAGQVQGAEQSYGSLYFAHRSGGECSLDGYQQSIFLLMTQWLAARLDAQTTRRSYQDANLRLKTSEERFRNLYEKTPAMLHSIDAAGRIGSVSDAWLAVMGYERDEVIGRRSTDFLTAESRRYAQEVVLPAYRASGSCHDVAYQFVTKAGDIRDIKLSATSECDHDGAFVRSLAVLVDVTDCKRTDQALIKKTAALERSSADLKQIARIASHDLQEPLRRVMTYCDILKEDFAAELPEEAAKIADIIQSGGRRLHLVINDLLDYVRIREQLDRAFEPVDMSAVICHALDDLQDEMASRQVQVDVAHLPLVWGRAPLLKMVCHHLLSNAIKHGGDEPPAIYVTVGDAGSLWQFAVTDRGIGVEERFADRIFDIFQRLQADSAGEGSGAGLAICRLIIERCGGDIWLDRSYQDGARFMFTLPKDKPEALDTLSGEPLTH